MNEYKFNQDPYWSSVEFHIDRDEADHLHQEGHRERLLDAASCVVSEANYLAGIGHEGTISILDYGCGNGGLCEALSLCDTQLYSPVEYKGYDICQANVDAARSKGLDVSFYDFAEDTSLANTDIAVMFEVLEHMQDPHGFLSRLPCTVLVASVPNGETPENHPEYHVWGWDSEAFEAMLVQAGFVGFRHVSYVQNSQIWVAWREEC